MNGQTIDSAAHAAGVARRRSLVGLGGVALVATLAGGRPARAGKVAKKAKKRVKKTCKRQDGQCAAFFTGRCQEMECAPEGLEAALACCAKLRSCDAGNFLECMATVDLEGSAPV